MTSGSVQLKKGKWYTVIYVKDANGKGKYKWQATGLAERGNKRKAEQILRERIAEHEKKSTLVNKDMLFSDYIREWLDEVIKTQVKASTYYQYGLIINNSVIPYFEKLNISLQDLQPIHIQKYYNKKTKEGLSGNTIKHHHANVHKALEYALKQNWIPYNPASRVDLPRIEEFSVDFYNDKQIKSLLEKAKGTAIETPILLAATYGFRRSEVLGIKWDAINFDKHTITIKHTVVPNVKGLLCADTTKNTSSKRTLRLIPFIEEHLKQVREKQKAMRKLLGYGYVQSDYVCVLDNGALIKPDYISRHFKKLLTDSGLPVIRLHDLRHSSASLLIANGCSLKEVGEWLGHSCITTTNRYAHLQSQATENMANIVGDRLFSAAG